MTDIDLLTLPEAAAALRIKPTTLRSWVLARKIRFQKLNGGKIVFKRADLVNFIDRFTIEPVEQEGR